MQNEVYTKYFLLLLLQMKTFYPFITSSDYLYEPPITLGLDLNKDCIGQQLQVKRIFLFFLQCRICLENDLPLFFSFSSNVARLPYSVNFSSSYLCQLRCKINMITPFHLKLVTSKSHGKFELILCNRRPFVRKSFHVKLKAILFKTYQVYL